MTAALIALGILALVLLVVAVLVVVLALRILDDRNRDRLLLIELSREHAEERRTLIQAVIAEDANELVRIMQAEDAPEMAARQAEALASLRGDRAARTSGYEVDGVTGEQMAPIGL